MMIPATVHAGHIWAKWRQMIWRHYDLAPLLLEELPPFMNSVDKLRENCAKRLMDDILHVLYVLYVCIIYVYICMYK